MTTADGPFRRFGRAVETAWADSVVRNVSPAAVNQLLASAVLVDLSGGDPVLPPFPESVAKPGEGQPALVVSGLVRVFVTSAHRQVTVQYCSESDVFGVPSLSSSSGPSSLSARGQALVASRVLLLSQKTFAELIDKDITVARAAIEGMRNALYDSISLMAENVLWPLRQRVAWHLLNLAVREGHQVVVPATVESIANATGTVREVVTRLLKELREEGLVGRQSGKLVLLDLRTMHEVAKGDHPRA